jgi:ABC-type bacteriocin/lantibiotic exporter with double-glycine peptidase domain
MQTFKKLLFLLTPAEQKHLGLLIGMILVMAILDTIGVASIMPFVLVLTNPDIIQTNIFLNAAYTKLGFENPEQFLFALGILVFVILLISLAFKAIATYMQLNFTMTPEYSIGKRLVESYLHQPYSWFLSRNSADLGQTILSQVHLVIQNGFVPMINLISQSTAVIVLITFLIYIDPKLTLIVGLTLIAAYVFISKVIQDRLVRIGTEVVKANQRRFSAISEIFGAFKEVKVGMLEQTCIQRFSDPTRIFVRHHVIMEIIKQLPRFFLETIFFGAMLLVALYFIKQSGSFARAISIIALYAFAGYRLIPALQQIYGSITQLRFVGPALNVLHAELMSLQPAHPSSSQNIGALNKAITLKHIHYSYPNAPKATIKDLSLTIPAKSIVGFIGVTGSGKTTTVDLIMGLLKAQKGTLAVDGQAVTEHNSRTWQRSIGYVPQQIYLADDTVAANIAFGVEAKDIDQEAIERSAKIANLNDFIVNEMPQQYQTIVGEHGARLSGGQRQRIAIARALYHNPKILILDEATSALDNLTEQVVMEAIKKLKHEITIILIAHRLSTVKDCDIIFLLEKGELKAQGTLEELTQTNKLFSATAVNH